jgi:DNA modification methylase
MPTETGSQLRPVIQSRFRTVYCASALAALAVIPDESVQCCVTSPPYWGLRNYKVIGQFGLEKTPEEYVEKLVSVFQEVRRVLRKDGVVFLNLGDCYFGGGRGGNPDDSHFQKQKTNRGSVGMPPSGPRVNACGISCKELEDSQAHDCLFGNLCGVCREVYVRTIHTDPMLSAMLLASLHETNRERMESLNVHLPTSDSSLSGDRTAISIQGTSEISNPASSRLRALLESTICESSPQLLGECLLRASRGECLLCARSLSYYDLACDGSSVCNYGTEKQSGALPHNKSDMLSSGLAYRHSTIASLKPKDLIGIPWLIALALRADGWYLRSDIIWSKPNPMPESVRDRPTRSHEYIFLLSKSRKYYYNSDAIAEPCSESSNERYQQDIDAQEGSHRGNGGLKTNGTMKTVGGPRSNKQRGHGRRHDGFNDRWDAMERSEQCSGMRNKRDVWTVAPASYREAHFATFPPKLIEPCILAGSKPDDIVLDPFAGSGTTGQVAIKNHRRALLNELNPDYIPLINRRTSIELQPELEMV